MKEVMDLIPGKLYKIRKSKITDIMRVCDGRDQDYMEKNADCPLLLLSDTTKARSVRTARTIRKTRKVQNKNNLTTTIFLVKDRTVEFRTVEILTDIYANHTRALLLNSLKELK